MNKPNFLFKTFLFLLILSAANVFAQTENRQPQAAPTFELTLQILVASDNAGGKTTLPASFANVVKKLKSSYSFADYRLATTFIQRTSDSVEYKSMLSDVLSGQDKNAPVFSEWTLRNLRKLPASNGGTAIQFESFRFGARVPVTMMRVNEENGRTTPITNYESIGISNTRFSLNENEPTVLGSLSTSKPDELMFVVLTVKAAQ